MSDLNSWPKDRLVQALEELTERYNALVKEQKQALVDNATLSALLVDLRNQNAVLKQANAKAKKP